MIPQIIMIAIWALGLGISMSEHGKPKKGNHDVWTTIIGIILTAWILHSGGFFNVFIK